MIISEIINLLRVKKITGQELEIKSYTLPDYLKKHLFSLSVL